MESRKSSKRVKQEFPNSGEALLVYVPFFLQALPVLWWRPAPFNFQFHASPLVLPIIWSFRSVLHSFLRWAHSLSDGSWVFAFYLLASFLTATPLSILISGILIGLLLVQFHWRILLVCYYLIEFCISDLGVILYAYTTPILTIHTTLGVLTFLGGIFLVSTSILIPLSEILQRPLPCPPN